MFFKHAMRNWMMIVHGAVDEKLEVLITRALPHAKETHFETLTWLGHVRRWCDTVTCAPPATVVFQLAFFPFVVPWMVEK